MQIIVQCVCFFVVFCTLLFELWWQGGCCVCVGACCLFVGQKTQPCAVCAGSLPRARLKKKFKNLFFCACNVPHNIPFEDLGRIGDLKFDSHPLRHWFAFCGNLAHQKNPCVVGFHSVVSYFQYLCVDKLVFQCEGAYLGFLCFARKPNILD